MGRHAKEFLSGPRTAEFLPLASATFPLQPQRRLVLFLPDVGAALAVAELLVVAVDGKGDTPSAALSTSNDPKPTAVNRPDITTRGWKPAVYRRG